MNKTTIEKTLEKLKKMVIEFNQLTPDQKIKQLQRIKIILEKITSTYVKGKVFEYFIAFLYEGYNFITQVKGRAGDGGADILIYQKSDMAKPLFIIQAKNQKNPLSVDEIRLEINKFKNNAAITYDCNIFKIISINGFRNTVSNGISYEEYVSLDNWDSICYLIKSYYENSLDKTDINYPRLELFPHNRIAYNKIKENLQSESKTAIIQATGTGKSSIIAQMMLDYFDEQKVIIAPTNYILNSFIRDYPWCERLTSFITYQKLCKMNDEELKSLQLSLIIFDECHHIGAVEWQKACERLISMNSKAKILGFSATPIRYFDNCRDIVKEFFDNNKSSELTLSDAIAREILPIPIYITSLYTIDDEINKYRKKIDDSSYSPTEKIELNKTLNQLRNSWQEDYSVPHLIENYVTRQTNNQKFIIFCEDCNHLVNMQHTVQRWFEEAFGHSYTINTHVVSYKKRHNQDILNRFKKNNNNYEIDLLFSIDMLNEGIHIKGVKGVFLLRRTMSPTIYYQQIGRALTVGNESPLIFDLVNNFDNVLSENFFFDIQRSKEKENNRRKLLGIPCVELEMFSDNRVDDVKLLFNEVDKKVNNYWNIMYEKLKEFYAEHQHSKVPTSYHDKQLVNWVILQRKYYKKGILSDEKKELLDKLDFFWGVTRTEFKQWVKLLHNYKETYGNLEVPHDYIVNNYHLGNFVRNIRAAYKSGKLKNKYKVILDQLGFPWQIRNSGENRYTFDDYYDEIQIFYNKYQHFYPHSQYTVREDMKLGQWASRIRGYYKNHTLPLDQEEQLKAINFPFESNDDFDWDDRYKELESYKEKYGHCNVPLVEIGTLYQNIFRRSHFGLWVDKQRMHYRNGTLSKERIEKLEMLGFQWEYDIIWENKFSMFEDYVKQTGNPNPVRVNKNDSNYMIINWLYNQIAEYKKHKLSSYKVKKMEDLGVIWYRNKVKREDKFPTQKWLEKFSMFEEVFNEFQANRQEGNTLESYLKGKRELYSWYIRQRSEYSNKKLSKIKLQFFKQIKFDFNAPNKIVLE